MQKLLYDIFKTPLGKMIACSTQSGVYAVAFLNGTTEKEILKEICKDNGFEPVLSAEKNRQIVRELKEYFKGSVKAFKAPLDLRGTAFQERVWKALLEIPYGKTATYGEVARKVGCPGGSRAVGMACNLNRLAIVIPCHRVIGSKGSLTGYASGLGIKQALLEHEKKHSTTGSP